MKNIQNKHNTGNYLGSYYKGNYVWGGAMNLAWNDLNENIVGEKLKLDTRDKMVLDMVEKLIMLFLERMTLIRKAII